jgi:predicted NBD/HSP70 family sugar kinase
MSINTPGNPTPPALSGAGRILQLVREGRARTRTEIMNCTGLGRSTVAQRVDALLASGLLVPGGERPSTGGRPSTMLAFNGDAGIVLAADLGATHGTLALTNLSGQILADRSEPLHIADGPTEILDWIGRGFAELVGRSGRSTAAVRCVGVGLPGPVEFATGRPVSPPIMPGWDRFPVGDVLRERLSTTVLVDNDVNIMALGEAFLSPTDADHLLFVKAATGIGLGYVTNGVVQRGAQGCFGDIGHIQLPEHNDVLCHCGNFGCVEAVAGGAALAAQLTLAGIPTEDAREVVEHIRAGVPEAIRATREAGRNIGIVLASVVNVLNPSRLVLGGELADAGDPLIAGIREIVYRRSTPLATRSLQIAQSSVGGLSGVIGAAAMAIEHVLSPAAVDAELTGPIGWLPLMDAEASDQIQS